MTHAEIWANSFQNPVPVSAKVQAWGDLQDAPYDTLHALRKALRKLCANMPAPYSVYGVCTNVHLYTVGHEFQHIKAFAALWPGTASADCSYPVEGNWIRYDTPGKWEGERLTRRLEFMQFMIDCIDLLLDEGWPALESVAGGDHVQAALRTDSE